MQCIKRSGQKVLDGSIVIAAIAVMTLGAVALASGGTDSPGWEWGRQNCNPAKPDSTVKNFNQCQSCCENMITDPNINETLELPNCQIAYCCYAFAHQGNLPSVCDPDEEEEEEEDEDEE